MCRTFCPGQLRFKDEWNITHTGLSPLGKPSCYKSSKEAIYFWPRCQGPLCRQVVLERTCRMAGALPVPVQARGNEGRACPLPRSYGDSGLAPCCWPAACFQSREPECKFPFSC